MKVDGNDRPVGLPITATSSRDGRGRPNSSLLDSPSVCSTRMATATTSSARIPAIRHAPSRAIAINRYLVGGCAVATIGATQAVPGEAAWRACAIATSPGKYGKSRAERPTISVIAAAVNRSVRWDDMAGHYSRFAAASASGGGSASSRVVIAANRCQRSAASAAATALPTNRRPSG